jgi:hypothetical protein
MDQAVQRRPSSPVARLFRANARSIMVTDRYDPAMADQAVDDVMIARKLLPENSPLALEESVNTHQSAAALYKVAGLLDKQRAALAQAEKDAAALKAFPDRSEAAQVRLVYLWYCGPPGAALDEANRLAGRSNPPMTQAFRALALYRSGTAQQLEQADAILDGARGQDYADLIHCCVLAERMGPGPALAFHEQTMQRKLVAMYRVHSIALLLLLGRNDLARAKSREAQKQSLQFLSGTASPYPRVLNYLAGDLSEQALLDADPNSRWHTALANYAVGLTRLAEGNRTAARQHFQKAVQARAIWMVAHDFSMIFLSRLEKDGNWPPWIGAQ